MQTYDHVNSDAGSAGEILPGRFINFLPPLEMATILKIRFGKTPNHALSYEHRDDPKKFFEIERPDLSIDLYSLNPRTIEGMYDLLHDSEAGFTWSAYSIPFFRGNYMSSTKLALFLLNHGSAGGFELPTHISVPVLREINFLWDKIKTSISPDGTIAIPVTLERLKAAVIARSGEAVELLTSIVKTITSFSVVTASECEAIATYIQTMEQENGIEHAVITEASARAEEQGDVAAGAGAGSVVEDDMLDPENFHSVTGLRK